MAASAAGTRANRWTSRDAQRTAIDLAAERGDGALLAEARQQLEAYEHGRVPAAAVGGG